MKKRYWLGIALGCICMGIASFYIGNYFSGGTILGEPEIQTLQLQIEPLPLSYENSYGDSYEDLQAVSLETEELPQDRVGKNTRLIFEHYNELDGNISRSETVAPHFLIGMDRDALIRYYEGFEVGYFSADEIVMRRHIRRPVIESFTLGIVDGYLAVFNGTEMLEEHLKEITNTLVAPLARDDRERLRMGITVRGEENLLNILQDYSS